MGGPLKIDNVVHDETDNFQKCSFLVDNVEYFSAENYFQCAKTTNLDDRELVRFSGCGDGCWAAGNKVKLRKDWEEVKVNEMYKGNKAKFEQNPELANALISSKGPLEGGISTKFWNYWNQQLLTRIRAELRGTEEDLKVASEIKYEMDKYAEQN